ncbi:MAG: hypothetical protein EOM91_16695 [Sphingobacteriia bacterium]|nr:hypothetical protein [Sphingobacteriia bacterium]
MNTEQAAALATAREVVQLAQAAETLFSNARKAAETIGALEQHLSQLKTAQADLIGQVTAFLPQLAAKSAALAEAEAISDDAEVSFMHHASRRTLEGACRALLAVSEGPAA